MEHLEIVQAQFEAIIGAVEEAIISQTLDGTVTSWNGGAERMFGYTAQEMIGNPVSILVPPDLIDEEAEILLHITRGESIEPFETRRARKSGALFDVSTSVFAVRDKNDSIISLLQITRDISGRKRLQQAERDQRFLASIVSSAEEAIVSKDLNGVVTSWNAAAERLFGYTAEEMIGRPIAILVPEDHFDEEPRILERIRRGERIAHYETKRSRKDGTIVDVAITVSPVKDEFGRIFGASKIARNITGEKLAAIRERDILQQARDARAQAEEANHAKDEFLATISHELRTPMTAILGWTRMLASGQLNPETEKTALESINRNAKSQAQLIEDLLDISRIVTGKLRIQIQPLDIVAVVAAAVDAVRPTAEMKHVRLQIAPGLESLAILGDFERLQQVIWNLLSNAIRFTPSGGTVRVEIHGRDSLVELRVADTGIGIKPEFLPRVFDRFTQADSSLTRTYGGLGMGLAIVKSIVELHGGMVSASSNGENQGATFTVNLPLKSGHWDSSVASSEKSSLSAASKDSEALAGLKILAVDDQPDTCELLRFIFNQCGAIVETASSAGEALQLLDRWNPDILISDIGMSKMDGYELMRIIRTEKGNPIPAVALTAMARIEDRVKALTAGYQMHVAKPVQPMELISIVASLVGLIPRNTLR